jgi:hypothetical protein
MFETAHRVVATTIPSKTRSRHAAKRDGSLQVAAWRQGLLELENSAAYNLTIDLVVPLSFLDSRF